MNSGSIKKIAAVIFAGVLLWAAKEVWAPGPRVFGLVSHQGRVVSHVMPAQAQTSGQQFVPQKAQSPSPSQKKSQKPQRNMGDWLREHKDLPIDQQEKLLESDPNFKKLTPDRQTALKDRLRKFNTLSPEQRDRALQRMQVMAKLTPEQRKEIRDANQQLQALPQQRRVLVHASLRKLRNMPADQRQQELQSEQFRSTFSDQEQNIIRQLSSIEVPHEAGPQSSPETQPR